MGEQVGPHTTKGSDELRARVEADIRGMFKLEAQRNDINFALSGVERGEMTIQDYEDDLSVALSNYFVNDLLMSHVATANREVLDAVERDVIGRDTQTFHTENGLSDYTNMQINIAITDLFNWIKSGSRGLDTERESFKEQMVHLITADFEGKGANKLRADQRAAIQKIRGDYD